MTKRSVVAVVVVLVPLTALFSQSAVDVLERWMIDFNSSLASLTFLGGFLVKNLNLPSWIERNVSTGSKVLAFSLVVALGLWGSGVRPDGALLPSIIISFAVASGVYGILKDWISNASLGFAGTMLESALEFLQKLFHVDRDSQKRKTEDVLRHMDTHEIANMLRECGKLQAIKSL